MRIDDTQLGKPETIYKGTKAAIEAAFATEGMHAWATDTHQQGYYNGTAWAWGAAAGSGDVLGPAISTNGNLAVWDGTNSKTLKDGGAPGGGTGIPVNGWIEADAMTYVTADDPTFTVTITGDQSAKYSVGMRIKLTQTTPKLFIITGVAVATDTTLTLYGGTDYDLANAAITSPYYSPVKAPLGFPLDPAKWSVIVTDTTQRTQATPTVDTWYNLGTTACQIAIPIGIWHVSYKVSLEPYKGSGASVNQKATLSTANNSESDADFTTYVRETGASATVLVLTATVFTRKSIALSSKTTYYLNALCSSVVGAVSNITFANDYSKMVIRAECAYL